MNTIRRIVGGWRERVGGVESDLPRPCAISLIRRTNASKVAAPAALQALNMEFNMVLRTVMNDTNVLFDCVPSSSCGPRFR